MIASVNLLEHAIEALNNGCDILRPGFTPENAFVSMHALLSAINQNIQGGVFDRTDVLQRKPKPL